MSGKWKPTRAELVAAVLLLLLAALVAFGAASLVDPDQPGVARLVWWLFFATVLMIGIPWTESWTRRRR